MHDHDAENAFLAYVADPTPAREHAAEVAIAALRNERDNARRVAQWLYRRLPPAGREALGDASAWDWLEEAPPHVGPSDQTP